MRFDPDKTGMACFFGPLEGDIMEILWRLGPLSSKDVQFQLRIKRKLALTTTLTALTRLERKGLVQRSRPRRAYLFSATQTRTEFLKDRVNEIQNRLRSDFPEALPAARSSGVSAPKKKSPSKRRSRR